MDCRTCIFYVRCSMYEKDPDSSFDYSKANDCEDYFPITNSEGNLVRKAYGLNPIEAENTGNKTIPKILFLCDQKQCDVCSSDCNHTCVINHAVNFRKENGMYIEKESIKNLRKCFVGEKQATFHCWTESDKIILREQIPIRKGYLEKLLKEFKESNVLNSAFDVEHLKSFGGVVEYTDGTVDIVEPIKIRFAVEKENEDVRSEQDDGRI